MFQMRKRPIKSVYFFYKEHHLKVIFTGTRRLVRVIIAVLVEVAHLQEHNRTGSWLSTTKKPWTMKHISRQKHTWTPRKNTVLALSLTVEVVSPSDGSGGCKCKAMRINNKKSMLKNVRGSKIDVCFVKIYFCATWIRHHRWQCRSGRWHQQWRKL